MTEQTSGAGISAIAPRGGSFFSGLLQALEQTHPNMVLSTSAFTARQAELRDRDNPSQREANLTLQELYNVSIQEGEILGQMPDNLKRIVALEQQFMIGAECLVPDLIELKVPIDVSHQFGREPKKDDLAAYEAKFEEHRQLLRDAKFLNRLAMRELTAAFPQIKGAGGYVAYTDDFKAVLCKDPFSSIESVIQSIESGALGEILARAMGDRE